MKKTFVLVVLFVLPIVAYLFFASGVNHFGRLDVLVPEIDEISQWDSSVSLDGKITVLGFLGDALQDRKGNVFNLNQKIYKPFYEFYDFQFVMLVPQGQQHAVDALKKELGAFTDTSKWHFVFAPKAEIANYFKALNTPVQLEEDGGSPFVFIVDKDRNLRGRKDNDGKGPKYGYNTTSVAELNNVMEDDIKIILAEYRLALKKNNKDEES